MLVEEGKGKKKGNTWLGSILGADETSFGRWCQSSTWAAGCWAELPEGRDTREGFLSLSRMQIWELDLLCQCPHGITLLGLSSDWLGEAEHRHPPLSQLGRSHQGGKR